MKQIIPVMFGFNNDYAVAAAVALRSLLENASREYFYKLYVLHADISMENQTKLQEIQSQFRSRASLEFVNMETRFDDFWRLTKATAHYSKEMYYKFSAPVLFPQYRKIIISDADVVFLGDISASYFSLDATEDIYVAGVTCVGKILHFRDLYEKNFAPEEISKLVIGAGYMVFNLDRMRQDNVFSSFFNCFMLNHWRLIYPEQDVINLCCYPKIKFLSLRYMVCSFAYDLYTTDEDFDNDKVFSRLQLKEAFENPIQLHYAGDKKPWKDLHCTKSEEWLKYVAKTPFREQFYESRPLGDNLLVRDDDIEDMSVAIVPVESKVWFSRRGARAATMIVRTTGDIIGKICSKIWRRK